jgi:TubC N-terminal docking domain
MNASEVLIEARRLGLRLTRKGEDIAIRPASRLTPELRAAIRQNKDQILRDMLLRDALAYLAEHSDGDELTEALLPLEELLNDTYLDGGEEQFKSAVREYVRAGLRSYRAREEGAA